MKEIEEKIKIGNKDFSFDQDYFEKILQQKTLLEKLSPDHFIRPIHAEEIEHAWRTWKVPDHFRTWPTQKTTNPHAEGLTKSIERIAGLLGKNEERFKYDPEKERIKAQIIQALSNIYGWKEDNMKTPIDFENYEIPIEVKDYGLKHKPVLVRIFNFLSKRSMPYTRYFEYFREVAIHKNPKQVEYRNSVIHYPELRPFMTILEDKNTHQLVGYRVSDEKEYNEARKKLRYRL